MALDPRSRERLEALGRTLPQPLPAPEPRPGRRAPESSAPRHAVEIEENPEQLFRELMAASADGTVPPHLLERLQQLEQARAARRSATPAVGTGPTTASGTGGPVNGQARSGGGKGPRPKGLAGALRSQPGSEEAALYSAFAQLLLEDDQLD